MMGEYTADIARFRISKLVSSVKIAADDDGYGIELTFAGDRMQIIAHLEQLSQAFDSAIAELMESHHDN